MSAPHEGTVGVDWSAAVRAGHRLAPTGPAISAADAAQVVTDLRRYSGHAELAVREVTDLGLDLPVADARVVDRRGWITATAAGMQELTAPLTARLAAASRRATSGGAAGAQVGVVLGYLSGRVLGQYDPMQPPDNVAGAAVDAGLLLLVAPNIVKVERELAVVPRDFRLWVCLHESTHRLQFTAVPWLRDYFRGQVAEFGAVADVDSSELLGRMVRAIRGRGTERQSWIETVQTPEQRTVFDRLMALMSLLEGHADHVMDAVGPRVVPSVESIRSEFTRRRKKGKGPLDRLVRSLLGMDAKLSQYVKGEAFVSHVVQRAGMTAFNAVWQGPDSLPTRAEIANPESWMARVL